MSDNNFTVATTTTKIYTNGKNYNKKDRGFVLWGGRIWAIQGWIFGKRRTLLWYAGTYEEQPTIAISEGECGNEAVAISDGECGKEAEIRERKGIARTVQKTNQRKERIRWGKRIRGLERTELGKTRMEMRGVIAVVSARTSSFLEKIRCHRLKRNYD